MAVVPNISTLEILRLAIDRVKTAVPPGFPVEILTTTDPDAYNILAESGMALVALGPVRYEVPTDPTQRRTLLLRVYVGARNLYPAEDHRAAWGYTEDIVAAMRGYVMKVDGSFPVQWYVIGYEGIRESETSPGVFWCMAEFEAFDLTPRR